MNVRLGIPFFLFVGDWARTPSGDQQQHGAERIRRDAMTEEKSIIAYRRTCSIDGTGLSHFILMENE